MSVVKNYYSTDLFNVEEILSILAMQQRLKGRQLKRTFLQYIADVITHYTPTFTPKPTEKWPSNWQTYVFSSKKPDQLFGTFVANLIQLRVSAEEKRTFRASSFQDTNSKYAVITLNYDLVLENFVKYLEDCTFASRDIISFTSNGLDSGVQLAKLHGSVDTGIMIAPTWNKTLARKLLPAWRTAFELLSKANQIRIIGYSLPTADAYIKYLLRAAVIESPNLKRIDVLCRDNQKGSVYARYAEFIDYASFRFVSGNVVDYLSSIQGHSLQNVGVTTQIVDFRGLEPAHEEFFVAQAS